MSDLSEAAYTAGWMSGLEFVLWDAVVNGPRAYGYITITHEHIQQLRRLSELAGGWILFDDEQEEILVTFKTWKQRFAERQPALSL